MKDVRNSVDHAGVRQLVNAVEDYLEECKTLSPDTLHWYTHRLVVFSSWCQDNGIGLSDVTNRTLVKFQTHLLETCTPRKPGQKQVSSYTVHGYIQVIKGFLNWCTDDEEYEDEVSDRTVRRIKPPKVDTVIIETFTDKHIDALYAACQKEYNQHLRD